MKKIDKSKINDDQEIKDYRNFLVAADQRAQQDFDKTVLTLSCGAIGISFAFTKEIVDVAPVADLEWLTWSWRFWACSSLAILASHYFSHMSLLKTIKQVDQGNIYIQKPGGFWADLTGWTNLFGGLFFVVGVLTFIHFVSISSNK
jgi:hypothetical protein